MPQREKLKLEQVDENGTTNGVEIENVDENQ